MGSKGNQGKTKQLELEQAEVGMQIAADLKDAHGNVLLQTGTMLTESSIKSLLRRGVTDISIVDTDEPTLDPRIEQERVKNRLSKLFRKSHAEEPNRLLMDYVSLYRVGKKYE
ncbi:hypothetical protein [Undibacterium sp.]|uniref:hypothetical protein n=1 Tax=Undibacterium sp. TaxID=1914977 RepID=UPI00374D2AB1